MTSDPSGSTSLKAEILSTGDEVLLGDIVDTNSAFLCDQLKQLGVRTGRITAVGDDEAEIARTLTAISKRVDICLVTGGLGPTQDDLTAAACAQAAGVPLEMRKDALASMQVYFDARKFEMTPENRKQALLPASARILENHWGTAPGFKVGIGGCDFYFMPGVPSEMKAMVADLVVPDIKGRLGLVHDIAIERLTVFGLGESKTGALLEGFDPIFSGIRLGFRAQFPTIEVKLVQAGACLADLARAKEWVMERLGNKVVSTKGRSLAAEVGHLMVERGQTLAVAESCTGGLIASWITDVAGSSDFFLFSGVTYANPAKEEILGVKHQTLIDNGAVHETTALEMAQGTRNRGGAHWGISTTGIAGPTGGTTDKPVGTVCIGVSGPGVDRARRYVFNFNDRGRHKLIFAATALEVLRRELVKAKNATPCAE